MRLRNTLNGYEYDAELRTDRAESSYGQAVLVDADTGDAVDRIAMSMTEIVEATAEERAALADAGYRLASVED